MGVSQPRCVAKLFIRHELEQLDVRIKNPAIDIGAIESGTGQHNYRVVTDKIQNSSNRYDENGVSSMDTLHIDFISTTISLSNAEHSVVATSVFAKGALLATNC